MHLEFLISLPEVDDNIPSLVRGHRGRKRQVSQMHIFKATIMRANNAESCDAKYSDERIKLGKSLLILCV